MAGERQRHFETDWIHFELGQIQRVSQGTTVNSLKLIIVFSAPFYELDSPRDEDFRDLRARE